MSPHGSRLKAVEMLAAVRFEILRKTHEKSNMGIGTTVNEAFATDSCFFHLITVYLHSSGGKNCVQRSHLQRLIGGVTGLVQMFKDNSDEMQI